MEYFQSMINADQKTIRQRMLKKWIDDNFDGKQSKFLDDYALRNPEKPLNQGECSGLINGVKSFGEKKARKIEREAGMPDMYLDSLQTKVIKRLIDPDSLGKKLIEIYNTLNPARKHELLLFANDLILSQTREAGTELNPYPESPKIKHKL